jgi:hypothetical protein
MAYSDFTLSQVLRRFSLNLIENRDLFAPAPEVEPTEMLRITLAENAPLALAMRTEKARSELLIAPILLEVRRAAGGEVSLFSGAEFSVDSSQGLNGACDFLMTKSPRQVFIESPVLAIFEAKKEDIVGGLGQCAAAMVAAQRFNEQEGTTIPVLFGAVTTGDLWKFLVLDGNDLFLDGPTYYLDQIKTILGILNRIVRS